MSVQLILGSSIKFWDSYSCYFRFEKDPDLISGPMTGSLILYSLVFMRYSMALLLKIIYYLGVILLMNWHN